MIQLRFQELRRRKAFKEQRNLPLRTIAAETGLAIGTLQRLSTGEIDGVRLSTLNILCSYFGVESINELVEYVTEKSKQ